MDQIRIKNLEVYAYHGVLPEEREKGQKFYVNASLDTDTRQAGQRDDLRLSVDYGAVCQVIHTAMTERAFRIIEAAAEHVAETVLLRFSNLKSLDLEVYKPDAPIGLPFETVSVRITRGWKQVFLSVGSNLGDKRAQIEHAVLQLQKEPKLRGVTCSSLIETEPYGGVEQDQFLNGAIRLETLLTPMELLELLHRLEQEAGRTREVRWGPRTLDLDILFYEGVVMDRQELTIPHRDLQNRSFVLEPMAELAPYYQHPISGKTILQMLDELRRR